MRLSSSLGAMEIDNSTIQECDVLFNGGSSPVSITNVVSSNQNGGSSIRVDTNEGSVQVWVWCRCCNTRFGDGHAEL